MELHSAVLKYFSWKILGLHQHFVLNLFGEKRFVNSVKVFHAGINSTKPIQKYPHIIQSFACILKIFVFMFLSLVNVLISFGICYTPKESK